MARTAGSKPSSGISRIRSLGRLCALLFGWPWFLQAQTQQVVLHAGRAPQLVMACARPRLRGIEDPDLGRAFLAVALWDLAHSGAVQPLEDPEPPSDPARRQAGATLLMQTSLARSWTGKLLIKVEVSDLGSEARVFRKVYSCEDKLVARTAHRLVDDVVGALTGTPGVAGSRIVFVHERAPGRKELYQVDPDGRNLLRLTRFESLTLSPSVTEAGKLAFVTYVDGLPHVWGQRRRRDAAACLVPPDPRTRTMAFTPAWSPDGKRLAYVQPGARGDSDICILDLDTGKTRQLTGQAGINTEPAWSPTGQQLAFVSDREGTPQVYLMERDGSNLRRLTREGTYNASPAWSPDGAMIAYVSRLDGRFNLFVHKLAEGRAYQITRGADSSESPAWSPDGRWLVFASAQDSLRQLYVVDLSGTNLRRLADLTACQSPQWSRSR